MENAHTYSLADPKQRKMVLSKLEKMVVKCREGYGRHDVLIGPEASNQTLEDFKVNSSSSGLVKGTWVLK